VPDFVEISFDMGIAVYTCANGHEKKAAPNKAPKAPAHALSLLSGFAAESFSQSR
jgi:hypothetical protein